MALVNRNGRPYLYKSVRRDGRVTSKCVASGEVAVLISRMELIDREKMEFDRWEVA